MFDIDAKCQLVPEGEYSLTYILSKSLLSWLNKLAVPSQHMTETWKRINQGQIHSN